MKLLPDTKIMRFSVIAFAITLPLGLLSMGVLGIGLYYVLYVLLNMLYPPINSWHGDWVWPAMLMVGMLWSFGFLIAGWVCLKISQLKKEHFDFTKPTLTIIYISILILWDLILWLSILSSQPENYLI